MVAWCTREERAGALTLDLDTEPPSYPHTLRGDCGCGVTHLAGDQPTEATSSERRIDAVYPYHDKDGRVLFEVVRFVPKGFSQRRPNGNGGYIWNLTGVDRVPYRLPELLASTGPVYVIEGEKAVDRLLALGVPATCPPGGAGKWRTAMGRWLRGRTAVVIGDNDPLDDKGHRAGQEGAVKTATALVAAGVDTRCLQTLPGTRENHEGLDDWLDAGHDLTELADIVANTEPFQAVPPSGNGSNGHHEPEEPEKPEHLFTDTRNAHRLVALHGGDLRFDHTRGLWRHYDGVQWKLDQTERIMLTAKDVVRSMHEEIAQVKLDDFQRWSGLRRAVMAVESTGRLKAMISNAQSDLSATHDTWDPDPYLLNCSNGTIDLRSGVLLPHDPELWQSKLAPVAYDPDAKCPTWDAFLDRIFEGDQELISFVQRAAGLSLVGAVVEHVLFVLWGVGANGKSTLLTAMLEVLGDYGRAAAHDLLVQRDTPQHSTNIAELRGVRLVSTVETEGLGRLSEMLVKVLTGGDTRNARFLYQDSFTYVPSDTFWLATNHKPVIRDNSEGFWRRVRMVPFKVQIPKAEQDVRLSVKLRAEYPGILAWMVRGCLDWQAGGLGHAPAVDAATAGYRSEVDSLANFLDDATIRDPGARTAAADLYEKYVDWCKENGEKPAPQRFFGIRLSDQGMERCRYGRANRWHWIGIRLRGSDLFDPPPGAQYEPFEPSANPSRTDTDLSGSPESADPTTLSLNTNPTNPSSAPEKGVESEKREGGEESRSREDQRVENRGSMGSQGSHGSPAAAESKTVQRRYPPAPRRADYQTEEEYLDACTAHGVELRRIAEEDRRGV